MLQVMIGYVRARWGFSGGSQSEGGAIVEYILLVTLIAVACLLAVSFLGGSASSKYHAVGESVRGV